jgi:predicted anti-sigma-YlaC factor YlaD
MPKHYSEADLLETYYMQPGESMPVMMHLAHCSECAARYARLERKLREAAVCHPTEKPETFWTRQRFAIMRKIENGARAKAPTARGMRAAIAAAVVTFLLGTAIVYRTTSDTAEPVKHVTHVVPSQSVEQPADFDAAASDPWQSDELKDFHPVVQWESWVDEKNSL